MVYKLAQTMDPILPIGETIRSLRKKKRIKQKEFAKNVSISVPYLSLIENNKERPSLHLIKKIALKLEVEPEELILTAYEKTPQNERLKGKRRKEVKNILKDVLSVL